MPGQGRRRRPLRLFGRIRLETARPDTNLADRLVFTQTE